MELFKFIILLFVTSLISSANSWHTLAQIKFFTDDGRPLDTKRDMPWEFHVELKFSGGIMLLNLFRNNFLFSSNYLETETTENETIHRKVKKDDFLCYYHGHVINYESSKVAVSLCNGLSGSIMMNNSMFELHPEEKLNNRWKYVYIEKSETQRKYFCGVKNTRRIPKKLHQRMKRNTNIFDSSKKYVEVYVAIDESHLKAMKYDMDKAIARSKAIINSASLFFNQINIVLVITGITSLRDKGVPYNPNGDEFIHLWKDYRSHRLQEWPAHDLGVLVTKQNFGRSIGVALNGVMCKLSNSVAFIVDTPNGFLTAVTLAHEIAHTFGAHHDEKYSDCKCSTSGCLMGTYLQDTADYSWSDCTISVIVAYYETGTDVCLYNGGNSTAGPMCGDGIQDSVEQCDCGGFPSHLCNEKCCDKKTCSLMSGKSCAQGLCCDVANCKLKNVGEICRPSKGDCDVKESCDGYSNLCPGDLWIPNGAACIGGNFCFKGDCVSKDKACSLAYGTTILASEDKCYEKNTKGDNFYNCGRDPNNIKAFVRCTMNNSMCGSLLCHAFPKSQQKSYKRVEGWLLIWGGNGVCASFYYDLFPGVPDLGYVPDGAKCGNGMLCLNKQCIKRRDFIIRTNRRKSAVIAGAIQLNIHRVTIAIFLIFMFCFM